MDDPSGFARAVAKEAQRLQIEVLIPVTDASIPPLLQVRERADSVVLPFPSERVYRAATDKHSLLRFARETGLSVPPTVQVESPDGVERARSAGLAPPYVVKSTLRVSLGEKPRRGAGVSYPPDDDALSLRLRHIPPSAYPVLVQERIRGHGHGIFLLRWDGRTLATFAHRRIRERPPSGGVSVYRESVRPDPDLVRASERLLEALDWRGVAMVEFKIEEGSGKPYLMEVNGRFWGSLQLAVDSGVDFPVLLVEAALGRRPEPVTTYRTGIRSRWWWGDVDHLLARLRGSEPATTEGGGRLEALADFLVLWRPGDRSEVLRLSDPMPFVEETRRWVRDAWRGWRDGR